MRSMLTAMVIFPIMSTGILPTVNTRSRLPPSYREQTATSQPPSVMVHVTHHVLHAYGDLIVDAEAAKKANYVRRVALVQHFQLSHYLVAYGWLDVQHDHLRRRGREVCHHSNCNQHGCT